MGNDSSSPQAAPLSFADTGAAEDDASGIPDTGDA